MFSNNIPDSNGNKVKTIKYYVKVTLRWKSLDICIQTQCGFDLFKL